MLLTGAERLYHLDQAPPFLNQDEACNIWNAWCLLHTGADQDGAAWPIFSYRAFGENRSTLFLYFLLPFQAVGGMNEWTSRLPAWAAGLGSIALLYYVAGVWLGRWYGLLAAALLAWTGWHFQHTRWAHESCVGALLAIAPLAALTASRLLQPGKALSNSTAAELDQAAPAPGAAKTGASWKWALTAGLLFGIGCYGYPAVRLFLPLTGALIALVFSPALRAHARTSPGRKALTALVLGIGATFGPLAWRHLAASDAMLKRGAHTWVWASDDPPATRVARVAQRYVEHFRGAFLFHGGDAFVTQTPPPPMSGVLEWHYLPLLLLGVAGAGWACFRDPAARLTLLLVAAYPLGDCLNAHPSPHSMRSFPGLPGLVFAAAFGVRWAMSWVQSARPLVGAGTLLAALILHARFLQSYFGGYQTIIAGTNVFFPDLYQAMAILKPQFASLGAVVVTPTYFRMPYAISLVGLQYDPKRFRSEPHIRADFDEWDIYLRCGKLHFPQEFNVPALRTILRDLKPGDAVALISRPREVEGVPPTFIYRGPENTPFLELRLLRVADLERLRIHRLTPKPAS